MNIISEILNFLKDGSLSFGKKSLVIIFIIFSTIAINYSFNFSFNYSINQELNQVEKIAKIRKEYILNDTLKNELELIEKSIIQKNNRFRNIIKNFKSTPTDSSLYLKNDIIILGDSTKIDNSNERELFYSKENTRVLKERSWIKYLLSSSYGFIIILIFLPFVPFFNIKEFWRTFLGALIFIVIDLGLIWLNYKLYSLIPDFKKLWLNYTLNLILHTIFIVIIIIISIRLSKIKK